jgi:hypothetical protein
MLRLSLALLLLLVAWPAQADTTREEIRRQLISSCKFWGTCGQYFRPKHRAPYRHYELRAERVYGYRRDGDDERHRVPSYCPDRYVSKAGEERYGRDRAKQAAAQAWAEEVRNQCGVLWMDVRNVREGTYECVESATGNRKSEQGVATVGQVLEQCVLRAKPGRAKLEPVNRE